MKIYSLITICITLGLFYGLAVFEQNKKANEENEEASMNQKMFYHKNLVCKSSVAFEEQSFEMMVSGKDHRYLNTGITFLDHRIETELETFTFNSQLIASEE